MAISDYDTALAGLYAALDAPPPRRIEGCPCCINSRNVDVLLSKPLGVLSSEDLSRYASGVFLTVGGQTDYRYLLPRILEISANETSWWPSPEITVGALKRAEWDHWASSDRKAIVTFLSVWFDRWAAATFIDEDGYAYGAEVEPLLCGIARAGLAIRPYLDRLLIPANQAALKLLYNTCGDAACSGSKATNFWEDAENGWAELVTFLKSSAVGEQVGSAPHPSTNTGPQAT